MKINSISDLTDVTGYEYFGKDFIVSGNGDISFVFELKLPGIFTLDGYEYNDLVRKLDHYISGQNDEVVFHKLDLCYIDKEEQKVYEANYTTKSDLDYFLGRPILEHKCFLVVSYPTIVDNYWPTHSSTSFIKSSSLISKDLFSEISKKSTRVREEVTALENELKGNTELKVEKLNKQDIIDFIFNIFNASFDNWVKNVESSYKIDPIEVTDEYVRVGQEYVGIVSFTGESQKFGSFSDNLEVIDTEVFDTGFTFKNRFGLPTSLGYAINLGTPIKHIVHTIIQPRHNKNIEEQLSKENRGLTFLRGIGSPEAAKKQNDIKLYKDHITVSKGCTFCQSVWVYADDRKNLKKYLSQVKSQYRNVTLGGSGVESFIENKQTANLYFSTMPGIARENFMYLYGTVQRAIAYMPLETHLSSDSNGFTFCDRFGRRIVINLRKSEFSTNPNKGVFGPSGTGKSVFLNTYHSQAVGMGYHVVVLDKGGSYKVNNGVNGGKYIDCGKKSNLSFNIFDTKKDAKGRYIYKEISDDNTGVNKVLFVYVILAKIVFGRKQEELETNERRRLYEKSIEEYYKAVNLEIVEGKDVKMSFTGYVKFFNKFYEKNAHIFQNHIVLSDFNLLVEPYIEGGDKDFLLNGDISFDITKDRFVVFDVQAIEKEVDLFNIVCIIIIDIVEQKLNSLPIYIPKIFTIDEALDFLGGTSMGPFIAGKYRKIRKMGGEVIIATQDAKFLEGCDQNTKNSILANMSYKVILGLDNEESIAAARILMGLVDKEIDLIKTLQPKREFFLKIRDYKMILRNELSPHTLAAFTTDPDELGVIREYEKRYQDFPTAINNYVSDQSDNKK